jgi:hypothetical protein
MSLERSANAQLMWAHSEIERLTRERDEAVADLDAHMPGIERWEEMVAERDRLRADLHAALKRNNVLELLAERDRLHALLAEALAAWEGVGPPIASAESLSSDKGEKHE